MLPEWIVDFHENLWTKMTVLSVEGLSCKLINRGYEQHMHMNKPDDNILLSLEFKFKQYIPDKIFKDIHIVCIIITVTMKKMISVVITKISKKNKAKAEYKLRGG